MEYLADSRQAKAIDTWTIQKTGIPSLVLMERAALAVADCVADMADRLSGRISIIAVCGSGNNGGDGIAAARILHSRGYHAAVLLAGQREKLSEDSRKQLNIAENLSVPIVNEADLRTYNIIIDALFGIGLSRDVTGDYACWIARVNEAAKAGSLVAAVDIPSGISSDTGAVMGTAVKAHRTVTFGYKKLGHIFYPGAVFSGQIICADIGFDPQAWPNMEAFPGLPDRRYITYTADEWVLIPARQADSHKGTYGRVLVIAGSHNMAGAAFFSASAAYRMGAGLVSVYTPESNRIILQSLLPEAVMGTYPDGEPDMDRLRQEMAGCQTLVLGPGLGQSKAAKTIVRTVTAEAACPLILDADALNILSEHPEWLAACRVPAVITPHIKELSRLTGHNIQYIKKNLVQVCEDFSVQNGVICIAKDARTMIVDGSETIYVNTTGNNGMSTGGSGDVLTGVIAGLLVQGLPLPAAARLGVWLHGLAGDLAAERQGEHAMTASDILAAIPELLKRAEAVLKQETACNWRKV